MPRFVFVILTSIWFTAAYSARAQADELLGSLLDSTLGCRDPHRDDDCYKTMGSLILNSGECRILTSPTHALMTNFLYLFSKLDEDKRNWANFETQLSLMSCEIYERKFFSHSNSSQTDSVCKSRLTFKIKPKAAKYWHPTSIGFANNSIEVIMDARLNLFLRLDPLGYQNLPQVNTYVIDLKKGLTGTWWRHINGVTVGGSMGLLDSYETKRAPPIAENETHCIKCHEIEKRGDLGMLKVPNLGSTPSTIENWVNEDCAKDSNLCDNMCGYARAKRITPTASLPGQVKIAAPNNDSELKKQICELELKRRAAFLLDEAKEDCQREGSRYTATNFLRKIDEYLRGANVACKEHLEYKELLDAVFRKRNLISQKYTEISREEGFKTAESSAICEAIKDINFN